jgi:predicted RND superfamily exporter protein
VPAAIVVLAALCVGGLLQFRVDSRVSSFLPGNDPTVQSLDEKAETFGGDAVVVLVETADERAILGDPSQLEKLLALEGRLAGTRDVATVYGPATVLNQVAISAQAVLARIGGREDALRYAAEEKARADGAGKAEIAAAGDAAVKDFKLRYGALIVQGLPAGLPTLRNSRFVETVVFASDGRSRPQWRFVVPNQKSIAILVRPRGGLDVRDEQRLVERVQAVVEKSGLETSRVTYSGVPAVTAGLADEITQELPVLAGLALVILLLRFLFVPAPGTRRDRLRPLGAAVAGSVLTLAVFGWLGVPLSLGSVALLPLLLSIGSSFPLYLRIVPNTRRVIVTAAASAAAFASLALSPLPFVRQLGFALAVGVVLTMLVALTFLASPPPEPTPSVATVLVRQGRRRWRLAVAVVAGVLAVLGASTLPSASIAADPRDLAAGLDAITGAERVEDVLGSSAEVSLLLRGPDVLTSDALDWQRRAQDKIVTQHGDQMRPVLTAPDLLRFLGDEPTPQQVTAAMDLLPRYISSAIVGPGRQEAVMTFGLRLQDLDEQTRLLDDVRQALPEPPAGYTAELVGLPVAAARGYDLVSADRYLPNVAGVVAAGVVLLIGLRRRDDAVRAVLAAVLATGWSLGLLALLDVALTPLSVALGSLTTVTASEFTVILAEARRRSSAISTRTVAWACATSVVGYLVLVTSSLVALREFGLILTATVLLSYAAARVVVWAWPIPSPPEVVPPAAAEKKEVLV